MEDQTRSLSEVAGLMGVSERTVRRWIKSGRLKAYKPGRDYRIPESDLWAFIEESEVSPKAPAPPSLERTFNDVLKEQEEEERRADRFATAIKAAVADKYVAAMMAPDTDPMIVAGMVDAIVGLHETVLAPMADEEIRQTLTREEGDEILDVSAKLLEAAGAGVQRLEEAAEDAGREEDAKRMREQIRQWSRRLGA